jgi:hypothetical protein
MERLMWVDDDRLLDLLQDRDGFGAFTRTLGFATGTTVIKGVHIMNDLAQTALGGCPSHDGDLLAATIREDKREGEDNSDEALRASPKLGAAYARAFPEDMPPYVRTCLRTAIAGLVNFDGGMYKAGDRMASGLVTHRSLLGAEGFRRFGVGRYLFGILGEVGQTRLQQIYSSPTDPYSRALAPLMWDAPLRESERSWVEVPTSAFDAALGAALTTLLEHPIAKPHLLRLFLHASTLGLILKVLGIGKPGGRPAILATSAEDDSKPALLREEAVQSVRHGLAALDASLAETLGRDDRLRSVSKPKPKGFAIEVAGDPASLISYARRSAFQSSKQVYWPDRFVFSLGKKAGCILPKDDRAGWGKRIALTSDLVEALILMFVPPGAPPERWGNLWAKIGDELGLMIGADTYTDANRLRSAGVMHVLADQLERNQSNLLTLAVRRGVARHLPDRGAEAGGELQ